MQGANIVEFLGGPLDGQRRIQQEFPAVLTVPVPPDWTGGHATTQEHTPGGRTVSYTLRTQPGTDRPAIGDDGQYTYEYHG
ncbi:hypothetical protein AB0H28_28605 [Micromonospora sp. NPDC050980]|uniref:hypothetical protein n=1 Tax=Micromonospora sp. NPDC050980 TaxID=3155161 RepID=UPI0033E11481